MTLAKKSLITGITLLFFAVLLGAFGAHALADMLERNNRVDVFETASRYHFYHAFALVVYGILLSLFDNVTLQRMILLCFLFGVLLFSGSLYILAIFNYSWLGALAPIGGALLLLGWALLAFVLLIVSKNESTDKGIRTTQGS